MSSALRRLRLVSALLLLAFAGAAAADQGDYDVVIVGGGPGGLTAAAKLAGQGHRVLVVEKRSTQRTRPQIVGIKDVSGETLRSIGAGMRDEERSRYMPHHDQVLPAHTTAPPSDTDPVAHMSRMVGTHTIAIHELEERLYDAAGKSPNVEIATLSGATGPPRYDGGLVRLTIAGPDGKERQVRAPYLIVSDGAGSETLRQLGVKTTVYAKGKLAAAFFKQKGRHTVIAADGVARLGDGRWTYTLNAISPETAAAGPEAIKETVRERGKAVGIKQGDPVKVWTFDTVMQKPDAVLLLDGHGFVVGDAAGTPHPFTAMGVNKAIVEGADAADTIHAMMQTHDEPARLNLGARWATRTLKGVAALHAAGLPHYAKYGEVRKVPRYVRQGQRQVRCAVGKAKLRDAARP